MINDRKINQKSTRRPGFTIVELLVVVVVIAILATITTVAFNSISSRADASKRLSEVAQIQTQLKLMSSAEQKIPGSAFINNCPDGGIAFQTLCTTAAVNTKNHKSTDSTSNREERISPDTLHQNNVQIPEGYAYYFLRDGREVPGDAKVRAAVISTYFKDPAYIPAINRPGLATDPVFPLSTAFTLALTAAGKDNVNYTPSLVTCKDGSTPSVSSGSPEWGEIDSAKYSIPAPSKSGSATGNLLYFKIRPFSCGTVNMGSVIGVLRTTSNNLGSAVFFVEQP